jgi:sulfate adenylyltransferase
MNSIVLDNRELCDLELLLNGGFYPLNGFLNKNDYNSVLDNMRLNSGELWPIPIVLSINEDKKKELLNKEKVILCDKTNLPIAELKIEDIYKPDLVKECKSIFGCDDDNHPYIKRILSNENNYYIGGTVTKLRLPLHYDFSDIRLTPKECKDYFKKNNWKTVLGFQTRNPMHRSHYELTKYALKCTGDKDAKLFLNPVVGVTQECDIDYFTRVKCYKLLTEYYPGNKVLLNLLPLSMRMAGPREALWHSLIRQNYGCTHFVVGRDHAGPSYNKKNGDKFFGPYDAHELLEKYSDELKIKVIKSQWIVYVEDTKSYMRIDQVPEGMKVLNISGTKQRELLRKGEEIPEWFSFPKVVDQLRKSFTPKNEQGFCIYFIGLSGSGKSTLANILKLKLMELLDSRNITLLDGDIVRQNLSKKLGFSKEDRSTNVRRIGFVASEIVKHKGIVICANIAPYDNDRLFNRNLISKNGGYIEIFVNTSLDICEKRDVKGLYKLAREGVIKQFTGISDPFEEPSKSDLTLNGNDKTDDLLNLIVNKIKEYNYM